MHANTQLSNYLKKENYRSQICIWKDDYHIVWADYDGGNRSDALLRAASEKLHHHKWFFHWNEVEGIKGIFSSTWDQRERTCANKTENTLKEVELSLSIVIGYIDGPFEKWMHAIAEPVLSFHWVSSFSLQMSENWEKDLNGYFS